MSGSACPAFPARAFCRGRFIFGLHLPAWGLVSNVAEHSAVTRM